MLKLTSIYNQIILEEISSSKNNNSNLNDNFYKWFGDSKTRENNNKPIVFYHGTGGNFSSFDHKFKEKNFKQSSLGFYFTSFPDPNVQKGRYYGTTASEYAENTEFKGGNPNVMPVYLKITNPLQINADGYYSEVSAIDKNADKIKELIKQNNYDGIISKYNKEEGNQIIAVVFNSFQIKSIYNNGEWNENNDNISETEILDESFSYIISKIFPKKVYKVGNKYNSNLNTYIDSKQQAEIEAKKNKENVIRSKEIKITKPLILIKDVIGNYRFESLLNNIFTEYIKPDSESFPKNIGSFEIKRIIKYAMDNGYGGIILRDTFNGEKVTTYIEF